MKSTYNFFIICIFCQLIEDFDIVGTPGFSCSAVLNVSLLVLKAFLLFKIKSDITSTMLSLAPKTDSSGGPIASVPDSLVLCHFLVCLLQLSPLLISAQEELKLGGNVGSQLFRTGGQTSEKCSVSLNILEMQIQTTMMYHLTPVTVVITKKTESSKCWQG